MRHAMSGLGLAMSTILFTFAVVLVWHLAARSGVVGRVFLADPLDAFGVIRDRLSSGALWDSVASTTWRMLAGWLAASALGIGLGAVIGMSHVAQVLLMPTLEAFRPLPASAAIPVAILIFGLTDTMAVAVVCFGAVWPVLLASIQGFRSIPHELHEVGAMYQMSRLRFLRDIALPSASTDIVSGLRIALALALILAVVTEMQASLPGVGYDIFIAQRTFRSPDLYAGLIVIGLIGLATSQCLLWIERWLFRWRDG